MTDHNSYWSRRAFLRSTALTGAGAAAFLAGCRSTSPGAPASATSSTAAPGATALYTVAEAKRGGTITVDGSEPTTGWDPHATAAAFTSAVVEPLHLKLIRHDYRRTPPYANGSDALVGELAEKWENPDPLTYTFTLRKGLNWPDQEPMSGRAITAEDVKYTFDHALLPTSTVQTYVYDNLASITVIDAQTVQLKLKRPNFFFPSDVDSISSLVLPKGYFEWAGKDSQEASKARGGGPWLLEEYKPGSVVKYKPNPTYQKYFGVPYADHLNIAILAGGAPKLQSFIARGIQVYNPSGGEVDPAKKSRPDAKFKDGLFLGGAGTSMSIKTTQKPFDDVRVRRALSMAVDRDGWGKVLQVPYKAESGPIAWAYPNWKTAPSDMPADTQKWLKYDVAEAKKLVDAAGIKSSTEYLLNYYPYDPTYTPQAQLLIDSANKIGITIKGKIYEYNNWLASAFIGKYDGLLYSPDAGLDRVSSGLADRLLKGSIKNHSDVSDDETQEMLKNFVGAKTDAAAKDLAKRLQIRSVDQAFSVYSPAPSATTLWDPALQNYEGERAFNYQYNYRYTFTWLS